MYDKNTSSSKQMQTLWAKRTVAVSPKVLLVASWLCEGELKMSDREVYTLCECGAEWVNEVHVTRVQS